MLIRAPNGRRFSDSRSDSEDWVESDPVDPRTLLPDKHRVFKDTILPDGTVLREWLEGPLKGPIAPLVELPDELEPDVSQGWRLDNPTPTSKGPSDDWKGPLGPRRS